jgi:anthranilate synthase component 1
MKSLEDIKKLAGQGNVIPLAREILADTETPVSVYSKISSGSVNAFLLESVEGGEKTARFSFLGVDPFMVFRSDRHSVTISGREEKTIQGNPIEILREYIRKYKPVDVPGLPPLTGGAVGYFAYDTIRFVEDIPDTGMDDLQVPELLFCFYDTIIAFDNRKHKIYIISNLIIDNPEDVEKEYDRAVNRIEEVHAKLKGSYLRPFKRATQVSEPKCNFSIENFEGAVEKCKEYIKAGDIFQVVLSQRFEVTTDADPFDIYRMLRIVNPSPYNFFLKLDDIFLIGASPEVLVRVEDGKITSRPLAGTRKRGKDEAEDLALEKELLEDPKELAEHLMLVDLGRNDVGRVSQYGSVKPEILFDIERYSHVMHISSTVTGQMAEGKDRFDALYSCMPAGTLSGAPKIRAMEIIDELEPTKRCVYGGAIGYIDFTGNLDTCIAIRTILMRGDKAYIQVGAGIVADSDPKTEYEETQNKARASFRALNLVKEYQG